MTPQKIKKRLQLCEFYTVIKRIALLRCHVRAPTKYLKNISLRLCHLSFSIILKTAFSQVTDW